MDWQDIETLVRQLRPYVDQAGLHMPDYEQIKSVLITAWIGVFGEDLYIEPDSQDGQLIAVFALALLDCYQAIEAVYHGYSPTTATGENLSRMVKLNGISRLKGSRSTVDLRIVGQPGTTIKNGLAKSKSGSEWDLPEVVVVPPAGEIIVTATARETGPVSAQAGEVTEIGTPTRGWQSVNNAKSATIGRATETDAELRARQRISTALPSRTVFDGTVGAVASVPGVLRWRGYENDTGLVDANGIPGHSICLVVEGGDSRAIAEAIARKKTPGCGTYGGTSISVIDEMGVPSLIRFQRPKVVSVAVRVTLKPRFGYLSVTGEDIKAAVVQHIKGGQIGDDVLVSRLSCPINSCDPTPNAPTFDVMKIEIGKKGQTLSPTNIPMGFADAPDITRADVEVVIAS